MDVACNKGANKAPSLHSLSSSRPSCQRQAACLRLERVQRPYGRRQSREMTVEAGTRGGATREME
jgi:hypothetical protein